MVRSLGALFILAAATSTSALQLMPSLQDDMVLRAPEIPAECAAVNQIKFRPGSLRYSNLGAHGPDFDEPPFLLYENATTSDNGDQMINMEVRVAEGDYIPWNTSKNGLTGTYVTVNLKSGTVAHLTFRFVDGITGNAVPIKHSFLFSIFDLDTDGVNDTTETVLASGFTKYYTAITTEVEVTQEPNSTTLFSATKEGTVKDNPTHPLGLSTKQKNRVVTLTFPANISEFNMTLQALTQDPFTGGRNFEFAGPTSLVCPPRALCSTLSCPTGYDPRPDPEYLACAGATCTPENDTETCCCTHDSAAYTFNEDHGILYQKSFAEGTADLLFPDVIPSFARNVDLTVKNETQYDAYDGASWSLVYGKINLAANTTTRFKFSFTERKNNTPFTLPPFRMSFFDIDDGPDYPCKEELMIDGLESYDLSSDTSLEVNDVPGRATFTSGELGDGEDNPIYYPLTSAQKAKEVQVTFPSLSQFSITFKVGPACTTGRNILFSRPAAIGYCHA